MWQVRERTGDLAISLVLCAAGIYWVATAYGMPPGEFNVFSELLGIRFPAGPWR